MFQGINASLVTGDTITYSDRPRNDGEFFILDFEAASDVVMAGRAVLLNFTIDTSSCMGPFIHLSLLTDGSTNLTAPIIANDTDTDGDGRMNSRDPDDDGDGHEDSRDAYPLDVTRWARPEGSKPTPVWWYASPLAILLIAVSIGVLWRRHKYRPRRPPGPENQ